MGIGMERVTEVRWLMRGGWLPVLLALFMVIGEVITTDAHAQGWDIEENRKGASKLLRKSNEAVSVFRQTDATMSRYFSQAYGYAVFPSVTKAGVGIGGARGKGVLYRGGAPVMKAYLTQFTVGAQLGGKKYREILFFRDKAAYDNFRDGSFEVSAQATAVVASDGAGETASYSEGVAIFVIDKAGAMVEASVGGQKFRVKPLR